MLASDGTSVAAVVVGEPVHLSASGGTVIASEPHDDGPWREVADGTVVHVTARRITWTEL
jgi:predicted glutamine amidotransferase